MALSARFRLGSQFPLPHDNHGRHRPRQRRRSRQTIGRTLCGSRRWRIPLSATRCAAARRSRADGLAKRGVQPSGKKYAPWTPKRRSPDHVVSLFGVPVASAGSWIAAIVRLGLGSSDRSGLHLGWQFGCDPGMNSGLQIAVRRNSRSLGGAVFLRPAWEDQMEPACLP
jgi:hypothetical protein